MKYILLFIFVSMFCHAQEYNKVTAYRLVEEVNDGPCSIVGYIKDVHSSFVYSAESNDAVMIKKLLEIKKKAKKWEKTGFWCTERTIGGDMIYNMFVFEGAKVNDTLFTSHYTVIFPAEQLAYLDKDNEIYRAFNKHFKAFFDKDFREDFNQLSNNIVLDSISSDNLMYKGKVVAQLNFTDIKNQTQSLKEIDVFESEEDSITDYFYTYEADRDIIKTKNNQSIDSVIINNPDTFSIDGIKVGSSEELVANRYPQSAKHPYPASTKFEEMEYKYDYEIMFKNNKGSAVISVNKKVVSNIEIRLY